MHIKQICMFILVCSSQYLGFKRNKFLNHKSKKYKHKSGSSSIRPIFADSSEYKPNVDVINQKSWNLPRNGIYTNREEIIGLVGDNNYFISDAVIGFEIDPNEPKSYFTDRDEIIDVFEPGLSERAYGYYAMQDSLLEGDIKIKETKIVQQNAQLVNQGVKKNLQAAVLSGYYIPSIYDLTKKYEDFPYSLLDIIIFGSYETPYLSIAKIINLLRLKNIEILAMIPYISDKTQALTNYRVAETIDIVIEAIKLLWFYKKKLIDKNTLISVPEFQLLLYVVPDWQSFLVQMIKMAKRSGVKMLDNANIREYCCNSVDTINNKHSNNDTNSKLKNIVTKLNINSAYNMNNLIPYPVSYLQTIV